MKFEKEIKELEEKLEQLKNAASREIIVCGVDLVSLPSNLQIHVANKQMTWQEAMDYAASIGMRLPTKFELQAIAASTEEFNDLDWTWSASTRSDLTTSAWSVNLGDGNTDNNDKTDSRSVLCVSP
jgi:hypothetical protein